jgi:hypothetical protein
MAKKLDDLKVAPYRTDEEEEKEKERVKNMPRNAKGQLLPGHGALNPGGFSRDARTAQKKLHMALKMVEKEKGISFLEHYIKLAFQDRTMAIALLKKIVPDLKAMELSSKEKEGFNIIMQNFVKKETTDGKK